jgi:hypothetical protein
MLDLLKAELDREAKRAIFTHGRVEDWYCAACSKALDIDRLPPELVIVKANGRAIARKVLCMPCIDERGGRESLTERLIDTVNQAIDDEHHASGHHGHHGKIITVEYL